MNVENSSPVQCNISMLQKGWGGVFPAPAYLEVSDYDVSSVHLEQEYGQKNMGMLSQKYGNA